MALSCMAVSGTSILTFIDDVIMMVATMVTEIKLKRNSSKII